MRTIQHFEKLLPETKDNVKSQRGLLTYERTAIDIHHWKGFLRTNRLILFFNFEIRWDHLEKWPQSLRFCGFEQKKPVVKSHPARGI